MKFEESKLPEKAVISEIEKILEEDHLYDEGHILGSMCTKPHEFAVKLAAMFPDRNLGDAGLFPGTARIEQETIEMLGDMLGEERVVGNIVTGGSEANIVAMRVARKARDIKPPAHPEVIVPESVHMSLFKAADFMGFDVRVLHLDKDYQIDLGDFERAINENTMAVVGIAGTTSLGLVDPIREMGKIIESTNPDIPFHVDAAFGGFVLPFLKELGHDVPDFGFEVPQVQSITCDPHKMGLNLIPSGGLILRKDYADRAESGFNIPYLAGGAFRHFNLTGTRPGNVVIACWGLMRALGREGFRNVVRRCWENTLYLRDRLKELSKYVEVAHEPLMNVVGIRSVTDIPMTEVDREMRRAGWFLGIFKNMDPPITRVVVMPHVTQESIDAFIVDFERILENLNK
jgi:tyrosine decarboxylase/aspartate 1-decarboxylase